MNYIKLILILCIYWCLEINPVRAEAIAPLPSDRLLQSGAFQLESGQLEKARQTFADVIALHPDIARHPKLNNRLDLTTKRVQSAYLNKGLASYRLGEYQSALNDLELARKIYPWQVEAHYNLGLAWSAQKEFEKAIAEYNTALTLVSSQANQIANIYNDRGLAYLSLHNFAAAINDFNLGIHYQGNNSWLHYNRGCACHRRGDYAEAINSFSRAISVNPQQSEAYINRGLIHYHLGHIELALLDLKAGANSFSRQGQTAQFETAMALIKEMSGKLQSAPNLAA